MTTTLEFFSAHLLFWLIHIGWMGIVVGIVALIGSRFVRKSKPERQYAVSLVSYAFLVLAIPMAGFLAVFSMPEMDQADSTGRNHVGYVSNLGQSLTRLSKRNLEGDLSTPKKGEAVANGLAENAQFSAPEPDSPLEIIPAVKQQSQGLDQAPTMTNVESSAPLSRWSHLPHLLNGRVAKTIAAIYLLGFCLMLIRLVMASWGCRRLVNQAAKVVDEKLIQVALDTSRQIGLKVAPALLVCERIAVPVVVGLFKPVVLLPKTVINSLPTEQLRAILAHELAHVRRFDHLVVVGQRAIESILFFHPVAWWFSRRLTEQRELCCDDLVIATGTTPLDYAKSLYHVAHAEQSRKLKVDLLGAAVDGANRSQLVTRIGRLLGEVPSSRVRRGFRTPSNIGAIVLALVFPAILLASTLLTHGEMGSVRGEPSDLTNAAQTNDDRSQASNFETYPLINGVVLDEAGDPVEGATVVVQEHAYKYPGTRLPKGEFRKRDDLTVLSKTKTVMDGSFRFENVRVPSFNSYIDSIYPISIVVLKDGHAVQWKHLEFISKNPIELTLAKPTTVSVNIDSKLKDVEAQLVGILKAKDWADAVRYADGPNRHIYDGLVWGPVRNATDSPVEISGSKLSISNLPPEKIALLKVSAADHLSKFIFLTNIKNAKAKLAKNSHARLSTEGDSVELLPSASIKLTIIDKSTKQPVVGATIMHREELGSSDANGKIELNGLEPNGRFRVGGMFQVQINPPSGTKLLGHSLAVKLSKSARNHNLKIELEEGVPLTGRVIEADSRVGVAGFWVRFDPTLAVKTPGIASIAKTNESGEYALVVPPVQGKVTIVNSIQGYESTNEYWTAGPDPTKPIRKGKVVSVEVDARVSGSEPKPVLVNKLKNDPNRFSNEFILVSIVDESGKPVPNAKIRFGGVNNSYGFSAPHSRRTDDKGQVKIELLKILRSYQKIVICAIDPANSFAGKEAYARPKEADPEDLAEFVKQLVEAKKTEDAAAVSIQIKLQPIATLSGIVLDADSESPVGQAVVQFHQKTDKDIKIWNTFFPPVETDSDGEYELKVFPGLEGYASVKHPEYAKRNSIAEDDYRWPQSGLTTQIIHRIVPIKIKKSAAIQPFEAPSVAHLSGANAYELLTEQFIAAQKELRQTTRNMNDPAKLQQQFRRCPYSSYVKSMLEVANSNEGKPIESKALAWACNVPMDGGNPNLNDRYRLRKKIGNRLMEGFVDSPDIRECLLNLIYSQEDPMGAAKKIFEANPDKSIKGESLLTIGNILLDSNNRERYAKEGNWLETMTDEEMESEAHKVFTQLKAEFADVPYRGNKNLGTIAAMQLFELDHLGVGDVVDDIQGIALDGNPMKLSDFRGKYVVLDFWGSWCGPCVGELPTLNRIAKEFKDDVVVVGVMNDKRVKAIEAVEKHDVVFRNWQEEDDGPIQTRWNISSWPTTYLIAPDGKVLSKRLRGDGLLIHISQLLKAKKKKVVSNPVETQSRNPSLPNKSDEKAESENKDQEPVSVSVLDSTGQAVANVEVEVWNFQASFPKGRSPINQFAPKGNWQLEETLISDMGGDVTLAAPDFSTKQFLLFAKSNGRAAISRIHISELGIGKTHQLKLKPTNKLVGFVQDFDTGEPISDCTLEVSTSIWPKVFGEAIKFETDEQGKFELTDLPANTNTIISPAKEGYHIFKTRTVDVGLRERNGVERPFKIELLSKKAYARSMKAANLMLPDVQNMKPADAFDALVKHYETSKARHKNARRYFRNEPARQFMHELKTLPVFAYREAFLKLASTSESDKKVVDQDVQFDALMWVIESDFWAHPTTSAIKDSIKQKVVELVNRFPLHKNIDDAFLQIRRYHPKRIEVLKRVLAEHTERTVRGRAAMALAGEYSTKGSGVGAPQYIDVSDLRYKQEQERKYCELTLREYADISDKGYSDRPLSFRANSGIEWLDLYGIGAQVPALEGKTIDDKPVSLADYRGKFVVMHFGINSSKLDSIREIKKKHSESVQVMSIASGDLEKTKLRAQYAKIDWPILWDPGQGNPFFSKLRHTYVPGLKWGTSEKHLELHSFGHFSTIVIDPKGKIVAGGLNGDELTELIDSLPSKK